jgi:hypothetical protein
MMRHGVPPCAGLFYVIATLLVLGVEWSTTGQQPASFVALSLVLGVGGVLAALLSWLVIELRIVYTRTHDVS